MPQEVIKKRKKYFLAKAGSEPATSRASPEGAFTRSATELGYTNCLGFFFLIHADFRDRRWSRPSFAYVTFEFSRVMASTLTIYHISDVI